MKVTPSSSLALQNPLKSFLINLFLQSHLEVLVVFVLLLYFFVYVHFGLRKRSQKRAFLYSTIAPVLRTQFSSVCEIPGDSLNEIALYATGRIHCKSCTIKYVSPPAQDLLSLLFLNHFFWSESNEYISMELAFFENDELAPIVFLATTPSRLPALLALNDDIRIFARQQVDVYLDKNLVARVESNASSLSVISASLQTEMRKQENRLYYVHLSDQINLKHRDPAERFLRAAVRAPSTIREVSELESFIVALIEQTDRWNSLRITDDSVVKSRQRVAALKKQE